MPLTHSSLHSIFSLRLPEVRVTVSPLLQPPGKSTPAKWDQRVGLTHASEIASPGAGCQLLPDLPLPPHSPRVHLAGREKGPRTAYRARKPTNEPNSRKTREAPRGAAASDLLAPKI